MRTMTTIVAMLLLTVGVGRGDPPSVPTTSNSPVAKSLPAVPPIPPAELNWKKTERIDTPAPLPPIEKPIEKGAKEEKPDAKKLKEEMEKLLKEQADKVKDKEKDHGEPTDERTRLRNKLDELVEKLDQQKKNPKPPTTQPKTETPVDSHGKPTAKPALPEGGKPIDLVRAAGNLFKAGDTEGAYEILRVLDTNQMPKEDRAFADYVRAACLRKMGKTTDALKLYRAIADAKDDPFLADSAVVQMTAIKSAQDLETQLEQLKSRRKMK